MNLPQELQAARLRLTNERPYLAYAAWAIQPIPKIGLGTMAVDMYWRLYYDPAVLTQWSVEEIVGVLYHEICHLLRNHAERMKDLDPQLANKAADAEINDDLIRERIKFPIQPLTPQALGLPENLLAEEYYYALADKNNQSGNGQSSDPSTSDKSVHSKLFADDHLSCSEENKQYKDTQASKEDTGANNLSDENYSKSSGTQEKYQHPEPGSGRCGSCATGHPEPWEDEAPVRGSLSGLSQIEGELIRRDIAAKIKEHSRSQGKVPGHLARWAEEKLQPKVNWRKQLAVAVRSAIADTVGATDYSYRRPSRRQGQVGNGDVIFPSMRCPVPAVAVVADTSGSISDHMIARTLAEIAGILKVLGQKEGIHVIAVDQTVQSCKRVFHSEQIHLAGGGGTNMGIGLEAAVRLKPLPQVGIVITDGFTTWPDHPPRGMKVIVVLSGEGKAPEWAKVIHIGA